VTVKSREQLDAEIQYHLSTMLKLGFADGFALLAFEADGKMRLHANLSVEVEQLLPDAFRTVADKVEKQLAARAKK
jgi:uncharacterized membrane protein YciS (DUF1049 family)